MHIIKLILSFLCGLIFVSCSSEAPEQAPPTLLFNKTKELKSKSFPLALDSLNTPQELLVIDSLLLVHDKIIKDDETYLYRVLNRYSGEIVSTFGREGRGPDEFLFPSFMSRVHGDNTIGIYNSSLSSYNELSVDSILTSSKLLTKAQHDVLGSYFRIVKYKDDLFIGTGRFQEGRYTLSDASGSPITTFGSYPFEERFQQLSYPELGMAFQSRIATHPNGERIVSVTSSSANLEIITLKNQEFEVINGVYSYPPIFSSESMGEDYLSVSIDRESRWGYHNLDVTNNYIYGLYSGKKLENDKFYFGQQVLVFNWDGTPIVQLILDREVSDITVDADDHTLYGIAENESGSPEIIFFEMDLN